MTKLLIGQLQFQVVYEDVRTNLDTAMVLAEKALMKEKLDFLVLPEMWSMGFISRKRMIENIDSTPYILKKFCHLAKHYQCHIICGSLPEIDGGNFYNSSFVINDEGQIISTYRKHKLFPLMNEPALFTHGAPPAVIKTKHGNIGLTICYDLRFPSLFQGLKDQEAQLVFLQAQFPAPRVEHWLTLNKARAIENQYFVIATNATGRGGNYDFFGRSLVIDPWGDIMSDAGDKTGYFITRIDLSLVEKVREKLPIV